MTDLLVLIGNNYSQLWSSSFGRNAIEDILISVLALRKWSDKGKKLNKHSLESSSQYGDYYYYAKNWCFDHMHCPRLL